MKESNKLIMMTHEIRKYITTLNGSSSCEVCLLSMKYLACCEVCLLYES